METTLIALMAFGHFHRFCLTMVLQTTYFLCGRIRPPLPDVQVQHQAPFCSLLVQKPSYMFGLVGIFKPPGRFWPQSGLGHKNQMTTGSPLIDPDGLQERKDRLQLSARWRVRPPMHIPEGP